MDRCTSSCDINEIILKTAFNTIQSIQLSESERDFLSQKLDQKAAVKMRLYVMCTLILMYDVCINPWRSMIHTDLNFSRKLPTWTLHWKLSAAIKLAPRSLSRVSSKKGISFSSFMTFSSASVNDVTVWPFTNGSPLESFNGTKPEVWMIPYNFGLDSFLTDDATRSFCGQCRSRSDCTEREVWSLIYTVHIFISRS